jgi:hypothetical protein
MDRVLTGDIAVIAMPIIRETLEAGKGVSTPMEVFIRFTLSFDHGGRDGEMLAERIATGPKAKAIPEARRAFLAEREQDAVRHPGFYSFFVPSGSH